MLQEDLASGRTAAEAAKEADARRETNRRRREAEAAAEVKSPVLVRLHLDLVPSHHVRRVITYWQLAAT